MLIWVAHVMVFEDRFDTWDLGGCCLQISIVGGGVWGDWEPQTASTGLGEPSGRSAVAVLEVEGGGGV